MSQFQEPLSLAEAVDRRNALLLEKAQVETAIQQWQGRDRAEAVSRCMFINAELGRLKASINRLTITESRAAKKFEVVTDGIERMKRLKDAMTGVWEYVEFLEQENADLRAENERLKAGGDADAVIDF